MTLTSLAFLTPGNFADDDPYTGRATPRCCTHSPRRSSGNAGAPSLTHITTDGRDRGFPPNVRGFLWSSSRHVADPLGTYTGWNTRAPGRGHGALHEFSGSTFPFTATEDERLFTGDPRPSVAKRYGDAAGYVARIRAAAEELAARRLLFDEDVERAVRAGANWSVPRPDAELP